MNLKHLKTYENFTINEGVYSNLEDDYESSVIAYDKLIRFVIRNCTEK